MVIIACFSMADRYGPYSPTFFSRTWSSSRSARSSRRNAHLHRGADHPIPIGDPGSAAVGHGGESLLELFVIRDRMPVLVGQLVCTFEPDLLGRSFHGADGLSPGPVEITVGTFLLDPETLLDPARPTARLSPDSAPPPRAYRASPPPGKWPATPAECTPPRRSPRR